MSDVMRCPSCGQLNRVPDLGSGKKALCGSCKTPLAAAHNGNGHPVELNDSNFLSTIKGGDYIVDFWAGWCGPCRMIAPVIEQLAAERSDVHFAKLNVDENPRSSAAFGAQSIPLLVFFRDGAEVGRVIGAVPKSQIEKAITRYFH
jgi:thioredoxin